MKKVLLDENLPNPLKKHFSEEFDVKTVYDYEWQALKNGELLKAITEEGINFLITGDRNLRYQQNLDKHLLQVVVLISYDNRYKTLKPWVPQIEEAMTGMQKEDKFIEVDLRKRD